MTTPTMNSDGAQRGWSMPTHPPYAKMIDAAIRFLAEEGGSTEEAISEYIRAHYDGLPEAHDRFLPYYLSRLTNLGHFVAGAPGRYLTTYSDNAPAEEHCTNPVTPLPVRENDGPSSHVDSSPLPPPPPAFDTVDGLDYVLALPNQGPVESADIKKDKPSVDEVMATSNAEDTSVPSNGEAKNEAEQPARTSMATSDHPLHTAMIPAATQNLSEDGGSTEVAKSGCIVADYDRLVPSYLDVDPANTENSSGTGTGTLPSTLHMSTYNHNWPTPPGYMAGSEPVLCVANNGLWQDAAAAAPSTAELNPGGAPGTSKPSPDSETGSTMSLPEHVVVDTFVQPPQLYTFPKPKYNGVRQQLGGSEDPCPVRRRRGRPPKRKINDTDLPQDGREITNNATPAAAAPGGGGVDGSDPLVRRRRGRPRKRPLNEGDRNSGDAQHGSGWSIQAQAQAPVLADGEFYAPMRSSEPAEPPTPVEVPPFEDWTTDKAFLLALLEGTNLELDASVRERLECVLTTPSVEATRSDDGQLPPPPAAWGNWLMAASGSFGVESMGWGVPGDTAAVPPGRVKCVLTTPSVVAARSGDGEPPPPPAAWGNGLMAASGSFGVESMGWGMPGDTAAVPPGRVKCVLTTPSVVAARSGDGEPPPPPAAWGNGLMAASGSFGVESMGWGMPGDTVAVPPGRVEYLLTTPSIEAARSDDGEPPPPPVAWGNGLMAASGSYGVESIWWGVPGGTAAVSLGRGRGRPPKGQGRRGRPRKNQF